MKFLVSKKVGQKSEYIHENAITYIIRTEMTLYKATKECPNLKNNLGLARTLFLLFRLKQKLVSVLHNCLLAK